LVNAASPVESHKLLPPQNMGHKSLMLLFAVTETFQFVAFANVFDALEFTDFCNGYLLLLEFPSESSFRRVLQILNIK